MVNEIVGYHIRPVLPNACLRSVGFAFALGTKGGGHTCGNPGNELRMSPVDFLVI